MWDVDTTKPIPAQEDDWDGGMASQYHDGGSPCRAPDRGVENLYSINDLYDLILLRLYEETEGSDSLLL